MNLLAWFAAALIAITGPAPAFAQGGERITAPAGGISIVVPKGWTIMPPDRAVENLRGLTYDSPVFRRAVETGRAPFFTIVKYPADREGINPTMKVNYQALPASLRGKNAVEVLHGVVAAMRQGFGNVELLDPPASVQFAGAPGAHVRIAYTLKGSLGTPFETISEMWITLRGDYAIILGVGYARDEPPETIVEIDRAAQSFWIDDSGPPPNFPSPQ